MDVRIPSTRELTYAALLDECQIAGCVVPVIFKRPSTTDSCEDSLVLCLPTWGERDTDAIRAASANICLRVGRDMPGQVHELFLVHDVPLEYLYGEWHTFALRLHKDR